MNDHVHAPRSTADTVRRLRPFIRPVRGSLALGLVLALVEVGVGLLQPWPLQWVVDNVLAPTRRGGAVPADGERLVMIAAGAYLAIVLVSALVDYWSTRLLSSSGLRLGNGLRLAVFDHMQRLSLRYHGRHSMGDLSTRVTGDVDRTQDMLVQVLAVLLPNAVLIAGMATVVIVIDPWFAMLALSATPLLAFATWRATVELKTSSRRARKAEGQVAAAATENLGAIEVVQAFSLENVQQERFSDFSGTSLAANLETVRLQARFSPIVDLTSAISVALVLWMGAYSVLNGRMSLGAAHTIASRFEAAIRDEFGPDAEVETHIEPLVVASLAGRDVDDGKAAEITASLRTHAATGGVITDVHSVRVRETGHGLVVNYHCRVDPSLDVTRVHECVDMLEHLARADFPAIGRIVSHTEPTRPAIPGEAVPATQS